jgi:hypothetical protein
MAVSLFKVLPQLGSIKRIMREDFRHLVAPEC